MKRTVSKLMMGVACITSFASVSYADYNDMIIHNLINSASNAAHDSHWGNQVPAWQLAKINWNVVAMGCQTEEPVCLMNVFTEVNSEHPLHIADITVNYESHEVMDVVNIDYRYKVCRDQNDLGELFLVRSGSSEFKKFC